MPDRTSHRDPAPSRLLPSFFLGGFECSTAVNSARQRIDELSLTRHEDLADDDYRRLRGAGILAARDGVRWHLVDQGGRLDFSSVVPLIDAANRHGVAVIWDLFHYGYPDDLDPFDGAFTERLVRYGRAFAHLLVAQARRRGPTGAFGPRFYTPINEISYFAWAAGDMGVFAPHAVGRGPELKRRLAYTAIQVVNAIREADPAARFVTCDPVVRVTAPMDAPWLTDSARHFNEVSVLEAWDMLAGRRAPELGGSPGHLDILGVNYYGINQWEHGRPERVLAADDPRRVPFGRILLDLWRRYRRPMIVAETCSIDEMRPDWLAMIVEQCLAARDLGADVQGVCIYPVVGMADWHSGEHLRMGLWDNLPSAAEWRVPHSPTLATLRRLQRRVEPRPIRPSRRTAPSRMAPA